MEYSVVVWKAIVWGVAILAVHMVVGNILYVNPVVSALFERHKVPAVMKDVDDFGGLGVYIGLNSAVGVYLVALILFLFLVLYPILPGSWLVKALVFGAGIILLKAVPEAFNQYMLFRYPPVLIVAQLVNSTISTLVLAVLTSLVYGVTGTIVWK